MKCTYSYLHMPILRSSCLLFYSSLGISLLQNFIIIKYLQDTCPSEKIRFIYFPYYIIYIYIYIYTHGQKKKEFWLKTSFKKSLGNLVLFSHTIQMFIFEEVLVFLLWKSLNSITLNSIYILWNHSGNPTDRRNQ